jgi:LAO/AO transport system kinase
LGNGSATVGLLAIKRWVRVIIADVDKDLQAESGEVAQMMARLRAGDVRALARAVSVVEDGGALAGELLAACREFGGRALRVGVTGPPGAGKSTLVDQMAKWLRADGQMVGVVAVDPSSPYTGGALLGDRIRMQGFVGDAGVFIRSMASRGAMGGVARAAEDVCAVMEAAGRQTILIETVGVGQDEVDVIGLADVTVLVLVPGMGDEVQSLKAGVMEVADVFVVNKSDRGGAELVEQEIVAMQGLAASRGGWVPPVVKTVATSGEGVGDLMVAVRECAAQQVERRVRLGEVRVDGLRLDHLGVAVKSIAAARGFYEALGLVVSHEETVEHEQVKTAMLPLGESRIELLEATQEDSTIGRFLSKRGEGLHHVAVHVEGIDAMFARLTKQGVRLASDAVRVGAGGHRYFFVHPASTGGVLLEIVGDGAASSGLNEGRE